MPVDQAQLEETLDELVVAFAESHSARITGHLTILAREAAHLLHVECVGVQLLDESDHIRTVAVTGPAANALGRVQEELGDASGMPSLPEQVHVVDDLAGIARYDDLNERVAGYGVRAVVTAPVIADGEIIGNLNVIQPMRYEWPADTVTGTQAFADLVGALLTIAAHGNAERSPPNEEE